VLFRSEIQADDRVRIEVAVSDATMPHKLFIPEEHRAGMEIENVSVMNRGAEVPFICKPFRGELFDGNPKRRSPYGELPLVPADPGGVIAIEVRNVTLETRRFMAEMLLLEEGVDYAPKTA
jgi:hypothetical protein